MRTTFIITLTIFIFSSCNKDNNEKPDYRNKYIGKYKCIKTGYYHCVDSTYTFDTTLVVFISKNKDSLINILDVTLKLYTNGEFGGGLYPVSSYHGFGGWFSNDSIFFNTYQGGLGCFTSLNYKGKKI